MTTMKEDKQIKMLELKLQKLKEKKAEQERKQKLIGFKIKNDNR